MKSITSKITETSFRIYLLLPVFFLLHISNANSQGLSELATNAGFNFGAGITIQQYIEKPDSLFKATLNKDFNMYFEGNKMKFKNVQPVRGQFDFWSYDSVLVMAEKNGKQVRGHCLIWHSIGQNPAWLRAGWEGTTKWTRAQLLDIMKVHITTVVNRYKGRIKEWDVVNEGVYLENGHPNGLRTSYWQQIIGDDYIDSAFVWAHRADPSAYLYYNEFGAEGAISSEYAKRDTVYNLMKRLLSKGIPVHGVGLQCHFGNWINAGAISANIKKLGELGLRVSMTEVDMMNTTNLPGNWKALLNAALENYNCNTFVTCGVDDGHSWFGKDCGCLAWDSVMVAKASIYKVLSDAFKAANPTITAQRKAFMSQPPYPQTPTPVVTTGTVYCEGETASPLSAVGKKLRWYNSLTSGIYDLFPPTPSTTVPGTKLYYVSQTLSSIESPKTEIKITVNKKETWYKDEDGDGKGDPAVFVQSCTQPVGYVSESSTGLYSAYHGAPGLLIYSEPANNTLKLKIANGESISSIKVFDMSGRMIEANNDINQTQIILGGNWCPGIYYVFACSATKKYSSKIVKLK